MSFDLLIHSCAESETWPSTLLHQHCIDSVSQRRISAQLRNEQKSLFIPSTGETYIDILEAYAGDEKYRRTKWNNTQDVKAHISEHLVKKLKDPRVRHMFLSADHSAAPLDCTYQAFLYLCTYHQVSPGFVDLLFSFGTNGRIRKDFHHTHLFQEIYSNATNACGIPEVGRSGYEMRVGYKLSAMEISDHDNKWVMRQTATYHSIDLSNGRSFWVTVKANDLIRDRILEASCDPAGRLHNIPAAIPESMIIALNTHLVNANWCVEGWRWYISSMDDEVQSIFDKITAAPIPAEETTLNPIPGLVRALSLPGADGAASISSSPRVTGLDASMASNVATGPSNVATQNSILAASPGLMTTEEDRKRQVQQTMKRLDILKEFSLKEMQRLNFVSSKLREAKMVMILNQRLLQELREAYQTMFDAPGFSEKVRSACAVELYEFQRHIKSLERFLESQCIRATTLESQLDDGKQVYGMILDEQSKEMEKLFAMSSHNSSVRMEKSSQWMERVTDSMHDIALTTEKDTSSMHVITFLTLIFLPGAFVCSLLSSPVFGDSSDSPSSGIFDPDMLWLFLEICLPMMVVTISMWIWYVWYKRRQRAGREGNRALKMC